MASIYGLIHSGLETLTGSAGNDQFYPVGGWDLLIGGGGIDTVYVLDTSKNYAITNTGNVNYIDAISGASSSQVQMQDIEFVQYLDKKVALWNNTQIHSTLSNEDFIGGSKVYSVVYPNALQNFNVQVNGYEAFVSPKGSMKTLSASSAQNLGQTAGQTSAAFQDHLLYISRLVFTDVGVSLDLGSNQSGGEALSLVNALLGSKGINTPSVMTMALNYFDAGHTMQQACNAAIAMGVIPTDPSDFVRTLWVNVMGTPLDASTLNFYVGQLTSQSSLPVAEANLLNLAISTSFNQADIQQIGVLQTGFSYSLS